MTDNPDVSDSLMALFKRFGFSRLTEIQRKASPVIMQKKDCLVIAPTGSGKTECAVIPIFSLLKKSLKPNKITMLYITPLRALNRDVFRRITKYAHADSLGIAIRHGDTTQKERRQITESPPDILITTPETLVILLTQPKMLAALSVLQWVVVDEVHELLSSERGSQLTLCLERLQMNSAFPLNRIGLSATVGNPLTASKFVAGAKRQCKVMRDTTVRQYDVEIMYVDGTITDVAQKIIHYIDASKLTSPILLFTNTRGEAEFMASILKDMSRVSVLLHHGSLSKEVREETEHVLRSGVCSIVVCTSSLELGLDIDSVELVVHYGSPRQVSKFVQRIGRSKHNRDSSARGLIVTNNADDEFEAQAILRRIRDGSIEEQIIHDNSLDVLAHHLVGLSMQVGGELTVADAFELVIQAYPFRNLQLSVLVDVLELLDANYLIFFDRTKMTFYKKGRAFKYYFENLSTIPDILKFRVFVIGSLDQRFVGDFGDSGNIFVLKGSQWRILNVDEKSFIVNVEPFRGGGITVPYWEGENIPIDYKTARQVGKYRSKVRDGQLKLVNDVIESLDFGDAGNNGNAGDNTNAGDDTNDDTNITTSTSNTANSNATNLIPDADTILVESCRAQGSIVVHACLGTKVNTTLAAIFSSMLSSILGHVVDSRSDGYRIVLSSSSRISQKLFFEVIKDEYDVSSIVSASLTGTHNVNWRTWCVAKKFGIVGRGAVYERKTARFLYERYSKTALVSEALRELFHDKYDLAACDDILRKIRDNVIHIIWQEVDKFSKLAEPILDHTAKYYSSPANLDKGIIDLVKTRLGKTKHRLICARCGQWERLTQTSDVPDRLFCPYCKCRQITATYPSDLDLPKIIRKQHTDKKLTKDEYHKYERAWKVASLIENFGKIAVTVISGYGVGADTAARILRNMVDGEEDHIFKQIYEAERQYVVTRGFWDS